MTLIARDQAGQSGESQPYEFILPERAFTKPFARAVVEQRKARARPKRAGWRGQCARCAHARRRQGDRRQRVYLAPCATPIGGCAATARPRGSRCVVDQLWSTALRIEEGDLPEAERALSAAQDALLQA